MFDIRNALRFHEKIEKRKYFTNFSKGFLLNLKTKFEYIRNPKITLKIWLKNVEIQSGNSKIIICKKILLINVFIRPYIMKLTLRFKLINLNMLNLPVIKNDKPKIFKTLIRIL